jgi:hypothetical protein
MQARKYARFLSGLKSKQAGKTGNSYTMEQTAVPPAALTKNCSKGNE